MEQAAHRNRWIGPSLLAADIAAATGVVTAPLIVLMLFFQRDIIEGPTQVESKE
ncbi:MULTISPECIES: hypothetical protein [unclassified Mesorhizobium]|uniref:hypothetical protein n=1 Tax=unclassified Mesorhizobium TaxID=325217 RepID=UPI003335B937